MLRALPAFALVLAVAAPAAAAAPLRLDLAEAMRRAEHSAPELAPRRAALRGARQVRDASSGVLATPPRVELAAGPRWRLDPSETAGIDVSVGAWQDFPLGGYLGVRRRFARSLESEARARLDVARHDARTHAALAWVDARLAAELLQIRQRSLTHAQEIARIAGERVRSGKTAPAEETIARAVVGRARAELLAIEGRKFVAETRLRHLTGIRSGTPLVLPGALDAGDRLPSGQRCVSPEVSAADALARRSALGAATTRAAGRPTLSVGPNVTREATGDWIALARVAFPLPIVDPVAVETARAQTDADVARAEAAATRRVLERERDLANEERHHAREVRDALARGVLTPAREALRQTLAQYAAGSIDTSVVLAARRELLGAEESWAEAAAEVRRADLMHARVLGCSGGAR